MVMSCYQKMSISPKNIPNSKANNFGNKHEGAWEPIAQCFGIRIDIINITINNSMINKGQNKLHLGRLFVGRIRCPFLAKSPRLLTRSDDPRHRKHNNVVHGNIACYS